MDSALKAPPDTILIELSSKVIFTIRHQLDLPSRQDKRYKNATT